MKETKNYHFSFVILHYQAIEETLNCVKSIKKNVKGNYSIIIVDNASPNNSGFILNEKYKGDPLIHCILSNENLGFAKGNNLGFNYAKHNLNSDFIICLNNDTLILQNNFTKKVVQEFNKSKCAVIAPLVYLKSGMIQNFNTKLKSLSEYQMELKKWELLDESLFNPILSKKTQLLNKLGLFGRFLRILKQCLTRQNAKRKENVLLHGCFLIFTPTYIRKFEGFDNRTFMFREEELLYIRLKKSNLLSVYNPKIKIIHLEDAATNKTYKTNDEKIRFLQKNQVMSLKILIKEMEDANHE